MSDCVFCHWQQVCTAAFNTTLNAVAKSESAQPFKQLFVLLVGPGDGSTAGFSLCGKLCIAYASIC